MVHKIVFADGTEITSGPGTKSSIMAIKTVAACNAETDIKAGSVCAQMVEARILTSHRITAGTEFTLYRAGSGRTAWNKVGRFICSSPTRSGRETYKVTAYDYITKLDIDLTSWLQGLSGWPYTVLDLARMVTTKCGVKLLNPSLPNGDFPVPKFGASKILGRQIMIWIGEICGMFLLADQDGNLKYDWYRETTTVIGGSSGVYIYGGSLKHEDYSVSPVEKVHIRLSQDDVGVAFPDDPQKANTYEVQGNYLLTNEASENLTPIAQHLYNRLKSVSYVPCSFSFEPTEAVHLGDIITAVDANGKSISVYVQKITIAGLRETVECTGSSSRSSTSAANNEIFLPMQGKFLEIAKDISGLHVTATQLGEGLTKATSAISVQAGRITTEVSARESAVSGLQSQITQQADEISAKVSATGGSDASFAHSLTAEGFKLTASDKVVFNVTKAGAELNGKITATSGEIGGWTLASGKLFGGGEGGLKVAAMQVPSAKTNWVFAAGGSSHESYSDCPFRVDKAGHLWATEATIKGRIEADSGYFKGKIEAASGSFTGTVRAKQILWSGENGYFSGAGLSGNSVTTSETSTGINTSLGHANFADDVFNNRDEAINIGCQTITIRGRYLGIDNKALQVLTVTIGGQKYNILAEKVI